MSGAQRLPVFLFCSILPPMPETKRPSLYLAGPEVFLPDALAVGEAKKALCAAYGFEGLFPLDNEIHARAPGERVDLVIYSANLAMMDEAIAAIVNLTPFRGVNADPGSVFELGYMAGRGKKVFGYTNVAADLAARIARENDLSLDEESGVWRDSQGLMVEDFGNAENLMIDACLALQNHPIIINDAPQDRLYADLTGFEQCLRLLAEQIQSGSL